MAQVLIETAFVTGILNFEWFNEKLFGQEGAVEFKESITLIIGLVERLSESSHPFIGQRK